MVKFIVTLFIIIGITGAIIYGFLTFGGKDMIISKIKEESMANCLRSMKDDKEIYENDDNIVDVDAYITNSCHCMTNSVVDSVTNNIEKDGVVNIVLNMGSIQNSINQSDYQSCFDTK